ncbi:ATP-binding protein [Nocardia australiensis]|uniref:ATP-binding protein n=1 Tax=Nocardia australiensis TaxID=2887191 RepID=UPI001D13CD1D|nr:ATP-binding protein [Nocardia australiensis]
MSSDGITELWDWIPGWILSALNFGQGYPDGHQGDLFDLGADWHTCADDLMNLKEELKSVTDETYKWYEDGDGAKDIKAQFDGLFDPDSPYSVDQLAQGFNDLGDYTSGGGTEIEFTKILDAIFAGITVNAIFSLLGDEPWGPPFIPVVLGIGRAMISAVGKEAIAKLATAAAEASLKNLLENYVKKITIQTSTKLLDKTLLKQLALATGKAALTGAALDAGIQGYQVLAGHREDFDVKQTVRTGLEWGGGGLLGAPVGMAAGNALAKVAVSDAVRNLSARNLFGRALLSPNVRGVLSGVAGGAIGGSAGMYGAGIAFQAGDHLLNPNDLDWKGVDWKFHPGLIAAGAGMGALHGPKAGAEQRLEVLKLSESSPGMDGAHAKPPPAVFEAAARSEAGKLAAELISATDSAKAATPAEAQRMAATRQRAQELFNGRTVDGKPVTQMERLTKLQAMEKEFTDPGNQVSDGTGHTENVAAAPNSRADLLSAEHAADSQPSQDVASRAGLAGEPRATVGRTGIEEAPRANLADAVNADHTSGLDTKNQEHAALPSHSEVQEQRGDIGTEQQERADLEAPRDLEREPSGAPEPLTPKAGVVSDCVQEAAHWLESDQRATVLEGPVPAPKSLAGVPLSEVRTAFGEARFEGFVSGKSSASGHAQIVDKLMREGKGTSAFVVEKRAQLNELGTSAHAYTVTYLGKTDGAHLFKVNGKSAIYTGTERGREWFRDETGLRKSLAELAGGARRADAVATEAVIVRDGVVIPGLGHPDAAPLDGAMLVGAEPVRPGEDPVHDVARYFEESAPRRGTEPDLLSPGERARIQALDNALGMDGALSGLENPMHELADLTQKAWVRGFLETPQDGSAPERMRPEHFRDLDADEHRPGEQYWRFEGDPQTRAENETMAHAHGFAGDSKPSPLPHATAEAIGGRSETRPSGAEPVPMDVTAAGDRLIEQLHVDRGAVRDHLAETIADQRYRTLLRAGAVEALDAVVARHAAATDPVHRAQIEEVRDMWSSLLDLSATDLTPDRLADTMTRLRAETMDRAVAVTELADTAQLARGESTAPGESPRPGASRRYDIEVDGQRLPVRLEADAADGWRVSHAERLLAPDVVVEPTSRPTHTETKPVGAWKWLKEALLDHEVNPQHPPSQLVPEGQTAALHGLGAWTHSDYLEHISTISPAFTVREVVNLWRARQRFFDFLRGRTNAIDVATQQDRHGHDYRPWVTEVAPETLVEMREHFERTGQLDRLAELEQDVRHPFAADEAPVRSPLEGRAGVERDVVAPVADAVSHESAAATRDALSAKGIELGDAADHREATGKALYELADEIGVTLPDLSPDSVQRAAGELRYRLVRQAAIAEMIVDVGHRFNAEDAHIKFSEPNKFRASDPLGTFEREAAGRGPLNARLLGWDGVNNRSVPGHPWWDLAHRDTPNGRKFFEHALRRTQLSAERAAWSHMLGEDPALLHAEQPHARVIDELYAGERESARLITEFDARAEAYRAADTRFGDIAAEMKDHAAQEWIRSQGGQPVAGSPGLARFANPSRLVVVDSGHNHDRLLADALADPRNAELAKRLTRGEVELEYRIGWADRAGQVHVAEVAAPQVRHFSGEVNGRNLEVTAVRAGDGPWRVIAESAAAEPAVQQAKTNEMELTPAQIDEAMRELAAHLGSSPADLAPDRLASAITRLRLGNGLRSARVEALAEYLGTMHDIDVYNSVQNRLSKLDLDRDALRSDPQRTLADYKLKHPGKAVDVDALAGQFRDRPGLLDWDPRVVDREMPVRDGDSWRQVADVFGDLPTIHNLDQFLDAMHDSAPDNYGATEVPVPDRDWLRMTGVELDAGSPADYRDIYEAFRDGDYDTLVVRERAQLEAVHEQLRAEVRQVASEISVLEELGERRDRNSSETPGMQANAGYGEARTPPDPSHRNTSTPTIGDGTTESFGVHGDSPPEAAPVNRCVPDSLDRLNSAQGDVVSVPSLDPNSASGVSWGQVRPHLRGVQLEGFAAERGSAGDKTVARGLIETGDGASAWVLEQRVTVDEQGIGSHSYTVTYEGRNPDGSHRFDVDGEQVTYHEDAAQGREWFTTAAGREVSITEIARGTREETAVTWAAVWRDGQVVEGVGDRDAVAPSDDLHIGQDPERDGGSGRGPQEPSVHAPPQISGGEHGRSPSSSRIANPLGEVERFFGEAPELRTGSADPLTVAERDYVHALADALGVGAELSGLRDPLLSLSDLAQMAWVRDFLEPAADGAPSHMRYPADFQPLSGPEQHPGVQYWRFEGDPLTRAQIEATERAQGRADLTMPESLRPANTDAIGRRTGTTASGPEPVPHSAEAVRDRLTAQLRVDHAQLRDHPAETIADQRYRTLLRAGAVEALDTATYRHADVIDPVHRAQLEQVRDSWARLLDVPIAELAPNRLADTITRLRAETVARAVSVRDLADTAQIARAAEQARTGGAVEPVDSVRIDLDIQGERVPVRLLVTEEGGWRIVAAERLPAPKVVEPQQMSVESVRSTGFRQWLTDARRFHKTNPVYPPSELVPASQAHTIESLGEILHIETLQHENLYSGDSKAYKASPLITVREIVTLWKSRERFIDFLRGHVTASNALVLRTTDGAEYRYWEIDADPALVRAEVGRSGLEDRFDPKSMPDATTPHPPGATGERPGVERDVVDPVEGAAAHRTSGETEQVLADWGRELGAAIEQRRAAGETLYEQAARHGIELHELSPDSVLRAVDEMHYRALRRAAAVEELAGAVRRFEAEDSRIGFREPNNLLGANPLERFEREVARAFGPGLTILSWEGVNNRSQPGHFWWDLGHRDHPTARQFFEDALRREQLRAERGSWAEILGIDPTAVRAEDLAEHRAQAREIARVADTFEDMAAAYRDADTAFGAHSDAMAAMVGEEWVRSQGGEPMTGAPGLARLGESRLVVIDTGLNHDRVLADALADPRNAELARELTHGEVELEYRVAWADRGGQVHVAELESPQVRHYSGVVQGKSLHATMLREGDGPWRVVDDPAAPESAPQPPRPNVENMPRDEVESGLDALAGQLGVARADLEPGRLEATVEKLRLENGVRAVRVEALLDQARTAIDFDAFVKFHDLADARTALSRSLGIEVEHLTPERLAEAIAAPAQRNSARLGKIDALVEYAKELRGIDASAVDVARDRLAKRLGVDPGELAPKKYIVDKVSGNPRYQLDLTSVHPGKLNRAIANLVHRSHARTGLFDTLTDYARELSAVDPYTEELRANSDAAPRDPRIADGELSVREVPADLREIIGDRDRFLTDIQDRGGEHLDPTDLQEPGGDWRRVASVGLEGATPKEYATVFKQFRTGNFDKLGVRTPGQLTALQERLRDEVRDTAAEIGSLEELAGHYNRTYLEPSTDSAAPDARRDREIGPESRTVTISEANRADPQELAATEAGAAASIETEKVESTATESARDRQPDHLPPESGATVADSMAHWPVEGHRETAAELTAAFERTAGDRPVVAHDISGAPGERWVRGAVTDRSRELPMRDAPDKQTGRVEPTEPGLLTELLEANAGSWGVEFGSDGTRTRWFQLFEAAGPHDPSKFAAEPVIDLAIPPDAFHEGISEFRQAVVDVLIEAGWPEPRREDVRLLVSELLTNVDRYAPEGDARLRVWLTTDGARVEVGDSSRALPTWRPESEFATFDIDAIEIDLNAWDLGELVAGSHGRGIGLIFELADRWGIDLERVGGKGIWFEVRRE